jgi:[pyruvate, water dikinase]-phosphate phosphotransferase / [pyruvate, water dikinase] kinase
MPRPTSDGTGAGRSPAGRRKAASRSAGRTGSKRRPQLPVTLYILSDSTGNLARHMLTAFLTQFPPNAFQVRARTFLQDRQRLDEALDEVVQTPGIVFHAVISRPLKAQIAARCEAAGAAHCDLTGDFVSFLARESGLSPEADHRRLHHVDEVYQRRIRAIEFALQHDDGLGLDTIHEADLVLAGVSRTSKSPTSIYLAQQGYNTANVSLATGVDPPPQLLGLGRNKVVGLVIDPAQLVEIRTRRAGEWHLAASRYNDPDAVQREIAWSRRLFIQRGWRILDVTDQAVEETAAKILNLMGLARSLPQ